MWLFRGRYRVETGDCRAAVADFDRAIALMPNDAAGGAGMLKPPLVSSAAFRRAATNSGGSIGNPRVCAYGFDVKSTGVVQVFRKPEEIEVPRRVT